MTNNLSEQAFVITTTGEKLAQLIGLRIQHEERSIGAFAEVRKDLQLRLDDASKFAAMSGQLRGSDTQRDIDSTRERLAVIDDAINEIRFDQKRLQWLAEQLDKSATYPLGVRDLALLGLTPSTESRRLNRY